MSDAIVAEGLVKKYGDVVALDGMELTVPEGTVFGLLGPNGAGKTTTVRVLTTLLTPDAGHATVAGYDVVTQADALRSHIGVSGQYAAVDDHLTGFENLEMVGRLYHLGARRSRLRARELLERFDLAEAADRPLKGYSGGMRRRIDLAGALVADPPVLFLDEPTTGLDPRARMALWDVIAELVAGGTTLLLTTQYMEEADRLADRIAVVDHGRVIALGTADELKRRVGNERIEVTVSDAETAVRVLTPLAAGEVQVVTADVRPAGANTPGAGHAAGGGRSTGALRVAATHGPTDPRDAVGGAADGRAGSAGGRVGPRGAADGRVDPRGLAGGAVGGRAGSRGGGGGRSAVVTVPVVNGAGALADALVRLAEAGVTVSDAGLRRPTLDDVFLTLTGHTSEAGE